MVSIGLQEPDDPFASRPPSAPLSTSIDQVIKSRREVVDRAASGLIFGSVLALESMARLYSNLCSNTRVDYHDFSAIQEDRAHVVCPQRWCWIAENGPSRWAGIRTSG